MGGAGANIDFTEAVEGMVEVLHRHMEAPQHSVFGRYIKELREGGADLDPSWFSAGVFVITYDVARLFREAVSLEGDEEFELPFRQTVFEFRVDGAPILAMWYPADGGNRCHITSERPGGGWLDSRFRQKNGTWQRLALDQQEAERIKAEPPEETAAAHAVFRFVLEQVEAISIALDATLFVTTQKPVDRRVNEERRRRGQPPLFSYHVLKVNMNGRSAVGPGGSGQRESRGVRLHIRRGHHHRFWTNQGLVKKWVRATWVGNPDLGFVDKEYRL